ncbi:ABC transporter ATP-binding protein [Limoniibacter endophyticus]|uniref:ABC transporter ATP-binding protein n=1 Tax=Limoniibacter endophyticus TaxID=1565040 RepID=A0A8J3DFN1_9HYPH|nr:dipeptide ABC transporter ATP-binding protein [Limoniibacter endophyticus]GHC60749.1 ABC transporter ATP-binding protein [Limoniibacter endophyticus]
MSLLKVENLNLSIAKAPILKEVSLEVEAGRTLAIVGESGSGKSMTALSVMGLLPVRTTTTGSIRLEGMEILGAPEAAMCRLRGREIGMVFQEPMTALNPLKTIGEQVSEGIRLHLRETKTVAEERARQMLDRVGLPTGRYPLSAYPHQLSGGQRQRVVIAIACALNPKLLIADEPTTALDVVLQKQILELLRDLVEERKMGLMLISHDLAVVADMAETICVMRNGVVQETGDAPRVLRERNHPYTAQLAKASAHRPERAPAHPVQSVTDEPLLHVHQVVRDYPARSRNLFSKSKEFRAVDGVSFDMMPGQSISLVGRSGCGKSTLARMILGLDRPTGGKITLDGTSLADATAEQMRSLRRQMQVVFQDPYGSFNPRRTVEWLVAEPLHLMERAPAKAERREMVREALASVGLSASDMQKYPHEFSGGQRQRISIARAIITRPRLIVADEPVSALDVSIRAQVLDLFADLNARLGLAYLFITHDLTVARAISDQVLVMHQGKIVERGPTETVLMQPQSLPAQALVDAAPDFERALNQRLQVKRA